jgi:hypothetical protein
MHRINVTRPRADMPSVTGSHEFSRCLAGVTSELNGLVQVSHTRSKPRKEIEEESSATRS